MAFRYAHTNLNVRDLSKSLAFYEEALGLQKLREKKAEDGSFTLAFLGDGEREVLELTFLEEHATRPYELGENETHIAFFTDDFEASHKKHEEMGCISFENKKMGIYFIVDPDGYWLEIIPQKR